MDGLLSGAQRKNGWPWAAGSGDATPYGLPHLLGRAVWSAADACAALQAYVQDHLGDPAGIGIVDETPCLKQGTHAAGVARPYSGTAGQVANGQVGVFLAYASPRGHTLRARALYLPRAWTEDPARLQAVGLAPDAPFAPKPALAQRMLARVVGADRPRAWVVGDTVYGHSRDWRAWREGQHLSYVLAVPRNETLKAGGNAWVVAEVYAQLAASDWQRLRAGPGSQGERWYDWQCFLLTAPAAAHRRHALLFRRSLTDPTDWRAYVVWAPRACDLATWVRVAGTRWRIEQAFEMAKQEVGLDDYEVRSAPGWDRHITLARWALALLSVVRAAAVPQPPRKKKRPPHDSLATFKQARGLAGP